MYAGPSLKSKLTRILTCLKLCELLKNRCCVDPVPGCQVRWLDVLRLAHLSCCLLLACLSLPYCLAVSLVGKYEIRQICYCSVIVVGKFAILSLCAILFHVYSLRFI